MLILFPNGIFHNKLLVNKLKTHCMIVTSNRKLLSHRLNINLNGTQIEQVKVTKYLGFCLNTKLCWSDHFNKLVKKIAPKIGLLRRLRNIVSILSTTLTPMCVLK